MIDNYDAGNVTNKTRHNDTRNRSNEKETEDNITGAHVVDDENDASTVDEQNANKESELEAPTSTDAMIMATVKNDTIVDPKQLYISMLLFNATTTVVPSTRGHSRDTIVEEETYQTQTNFTVDAAMLPNVLVEYVTLQGITLFSPDCS